MPLMCEDRLPHTRIRRCGRAPVGKNKYQHQCEKMECGLPHWAFLGHVTNVHQLFLLGFLFFSENEIHGQTDDHRKQHRPHHTGKPHGETKYARCQNDGEHTDGRAGIQERHGGAKAGSALVDAGEQRQNGARAYRQDATRHRCHSIRQPSLGVCTKVF